MRPRDYAQATHLPLPEAARRMGVSATTLRQMVYDGHVPRWAVVLGGRKTPHIYIAKSWLEVKPPAPSADGAPAVLSMSCVLPPLIGRRA